MNFFIIFFSYINKLPKNLSAKYYQENKERLQKKRLVKHIKRRKSRKINKNIFLDSTKFKIVWIKITTFFKRRASIIL